MKELALKLKKLLNKNENIIDLIIFGSLSKNKLKVMDIDIALLTKSKTNLKTDEIKRQIEEIIPAKEIDLQLFDIENYDRFLWITLIREGFSVKHNKYLHQVYGIVPVILYKYSLKKLTASQKVMFERAIKNFQDITKLSNRVVLVPITVSDQFEDFLRSWNLDLDSQEYGLLPLVRKEDF